MNLIHREQYSEILRQERVTEVIIQRLMDRYEFLPSDVLYTVTTDDRRMGYKRLSLNYSNEEIAAHDISMKFLALGYPVFDNIETQLRFLAGNIKRSANGLLWFTIGIPVGVIGATVGYFLGLN